MSARETFARRIDKQRKHHRFYLWFAVAVVVLSFVLIVRFDQRVALRPLPSVVLPESCPSRMLFGFDCPGCGLTRSFIYLAAGNLAASYSSHRVGWLMALAVLGQIPYRWFVLHRYRRMTALWSAGSTENSTLEGIEPIANSSTGLDLENSIESPNLFRTPAWIEYCARLLLIALLGNWILKVLGY